MKRTQQWWDCVTNIENGEHFSSFLLLLLLLLARETQNMSVAILSGKSLQWVLRSTNAMRTALFIVPNGSKTFEQKRNVSWYLGREEHQNYLAQASYFYSNPEYSQWKEKPFRNGKLSTTRLAEIVHRPFFI